MVRAILMLAITVIPYPSLLCLFKNNTTYQINSKNMQKKNCKLNKYYSIQAVHKTIQDKKKREMYNIN